MQQMKLESEDHFVDVVPGDSSSTVDFVMQANCSIQIETGKT
jgi:hypothetical protein